MLGDSMALTAAENGCLFRLETYAALVVASMCLLGSHSLFDIHPERNCTE